MRCFPLEHTLVRVGLLANCTPREKIARTIPPVLQFCNFVTHNWGLRQSRKPHIQRNDPAYNAPHLILTITAQAQRSICARSRLFKYLFFIIFFIFSAPLILTA